MSTIIDIARPLKKLKAMSFGCVGGIMPVDEEMRVTPETICMEKCQHGAYSIIFIDETQNVVDISYSIAKFYCYESCGKCTPCREGTIRMLNLLKKIRTGKGSKEDMALLCELANHIQDTSLCGLGQTCGNHILTSIQHFPKDYEAYMKKK
jgi:NADH:ubiquinone oxidoreductase subunit F (NADH-binding)